MLKIFIYIYACWYQKVCMKIEMSKIMIMFCIANETLLFTPAPAPATNHSHYFGSYILLLYCSILSRTTISFFFIFVFVFNFNEKSNAKSTMSNSTTKFNCIV